MESQFKTKGKSAKHGSLLAGLHHALQKESHPVNGTLSP
jgi:hypothetical protein